MSNITDWVKYELYPSLFHSIDSVFTEHNFKRYPGGWRSNTYLNGAKHKDRQDKTVITKQAPGRIFEQGGDNKSLVQYVMDRDSISFIEACTLLARSVNIELPKGDFNEGDYTKYRDRLNILEKSNDYFIYCLDKSPTKEAKEVKEYLKGRGYTEEDVKAMGLGYIPSREKLIDHLKKDYTEDQIKEALQLPTAVGNTHRLTIPFRSGGELKGFKFRTIGNEEPKYLNSVGLDKTGAFFNLSGLKEDKDIKIMEGELDSLHATIKGVTNVVGLGGSSVNIKQVKNALLMGAKSFTVCLDTEPGEEPKTIKNVKKVVEVLLEGGAKNIYVATLPPLGGGKTDPDTLIKEQGVEKLNEAIEQALPFSHYYLHSYVEHTEDKGSPRQLDKLKEEIVQIGGLINEPLDKDIFIKYVTDLPQIQAWGITKEALEITVDKVRATKDKEKQKEEIHKLLQEATKELREGDQEKALDILEKVKEVKLIDKVVNYSKLLLPTTEEGLRERVKNKKDSLKTGYEIGGEELVLPSGAISVIAGPTSHGKTTFLINLALGVLKNNPGKEVYFFSYEEDSDSVTISALNTYLNTDLSGNNKTTIRNSFKGLNKQQIDTKSFFTELIYTRKLNIHYTDYNSDELIEAIKYINEHANPGAIFIDYIQLLNLPEGKYKTYSRQEEMKNICRSLNELVSKTELPLIVGAQFNREVNSPDKIHATKIGEAGDIERIANLIVGFWNGNFKPFSEATATEEANKLQKDTLFSIVLKNREGRVGQSGLLKYNGNRGKIENTTTINKNVL